MRLLTDLGYTNLRLYTGGIADWVDHNLPVEGIRRVPGVAFTPRFGVAAALEALGNRSFTQLAGMWSVVVIASAALFWLACALPGHGLLQGGQPLPFDGRTFLDALYFSAVTATSVGYGDVTPVGAARVIALVEAVFELLLFGGVVSKFVSSRQDRLIEEVSESTFENELGRIRTNLHLVLMELHALGDVVSTSVPHPRLGDRVESGAVVFLGEMRAIHALLFRSRHEPEELVIETILASLESGLRAWSDVLAASPAAFTLSPLMRQSIEKMIGLSADICSDCVPRRYATDLTAQMDRVQTAGQKLRAHLHVP